MLQAFKVEHASPYWQSLGLACGNDHWFISKFCLWHWLIKHSAKKDIIRMAPEQLGYSEWSRINWFFQLDCEYFFKLFLQLVHLWLQHNWEPVVWISFVWGKKDEELVLCGNLGYCRETRYLRGDRFQQNLFSMQGAGTAASLIECFAITVLA